MIYFNTQKQQDIWAERFDRIIFSNKSTMAMRLNRNQRSREREERSKERSEMSKERSNRRHGAHSPVDVKSNMSNGNIFNIGR